jgi:type IV secretion system protein VirB10
VRNLGRKYLLLAFVLLPGVAGSQVGSEIVLGEGTRISLQLNDHLSTKLNNEGDTFTATVTAPVYLKDRLIIPKGSIISGSISRVLRPGRFKGKAVMNLLFSSIRLPGAAAQLPIVASLARVDQEGNAGVRGEGTIAGEDSKGRDAAKVAVPTLTGAGIGAIVNGGHGAGIGAGIGAAVGLATVLAGRGKDLELRRGSTMDIVLDRPLAIPSETAKRID